VEEASLMDDIEALFEDEDHSDLATNPKPDPQPNPK